MAGNGRKKVSCLFPQNLACSKVFLSQFFLNYKVWG